MKVEICAVGGHSEVGRNMTAVRYENEVIICDLGFNIPKIISFEEEGERAHLTRDLMIKHDIAPDDTKIESWRNMVKAIVPSHCHLDHLGAIPYYAERYRCPVIGTPYTIEVLKAIYHDEQRRPHNKLIVAQLNAKIKISQNISLEFVSMTHSTPHTAMVVIHTPAGQVIYGNDFKFDNTPTLGPKPNYKRLEELGNSGKVLCLISDSLYCGHKMKTPSEKVAKEMLKDVLLGISNKENAIIVTTFGSHIARLKSVIELAQMLGRKVVIIGRSMNRYVHAAENLKIVEFSKTCELVKFPRQARKRLRQIEKERDRYLIICTGNQAEPNSTLVKMSMDEIDFKFEPGDNVIFASKTIPVSINLENKAMLEEKLRRKGVRIFSDIHVSGHGAMEDIRDLISIVKPKHVIPSHGDITKVAPAATLAVEMGYELGKTVHLMENGKFVQLE